MDVPRAAVHQTRLGRGATDGLEVGGDVELLLGAHHQAHAVHPRHLLGAQLSIASRDDDEGVGVLAPSLADHVAAAAVGLLGDGAGVDDADVGTLPRTHATYALGQELPPYGGGLGEVQLAA